MNRLWPRLSQQPIRRKGILTESAILVAACILLLVLVGPGSPAASLVLNTGVLAASASAIVLVFFSVSRMSPSDRTPWLFLGLAQVLWFLGAFLMNYLQSLLVGVTSLTAIAHFLNLGGYGLACYALFRFPFKSQHAPARFRYVLDAVLSAGAVATIAFLVLARQIPASRSLMGYAEMVGYPIGDAILLVTLINLALANWVPRRTAVFLASGWLAGLFSDGARSSLALVGGYQTGSTFGLGWVCGPLLIGLGALYALGPDSAGRMEQAPSYSYDLGVQTQRVLPVALELVLVWYLLADWRLRGQYSAISLWMSVVLGAVLIVRLGIRAGEAELEQYWRLFNNIADPSFISDYRGKVLLGNPACRALLDAPESTNLAGQPLTRIFVGISDQDCWEASKRDRTLSVELARDSTPYLLTLSPIPRENRRALVAGVAHNLIEQKKQSDAMRRAFDELQAVYQQLGDLNAQLERKVDERTRTLSQAYAQLEEQNRVLQSLDQIKTDFVSMVSHELRAPLTNLGGGVELLLGRNESPAHAKTLLLMQAEIWRLTRFVENILNMSAMEAGRLVLRPTQLSLSVLAAEVQAQWCNLPEFARLRVDVSEDLPLVQADEGALRSVFGHLLDNALKYAPDSPVWITAILQGPSIRVTVRDQGPGIPEEKRGLLFQRFQRLDARDSQTVYGYGLGLYLSQRLLSAMGSQLLFEAPNGGGACFAFDLEVAQ